MTFKKQKSSVLCRNCVYVVLLLGAGLYSALWELLAGFVRQLRGIDSSVGHRLCGINGDNLLVWNRPVINPFICCLVSIVC